MKKPVKPVLIGQAPSRSTDGGAPFSGRCGAFLEELLETPRLSDLFELRNLLDRWPGKKGRGDAAPPSAMRAAAEKLLPSLCKRNVKVVFVGRAVAKAFGHGDRKFLTMFDAGCFQAMIMPHPSGLNTWWNLPANRLVARIALTAFACGGYQVGTWRIPGKWLTPVEQMDVDQYRVRVRDDDDGPDEAS